TLGELGLIYRLAPIVFVGGSLASPGGQKPIEPVKFGAAVLHGPDVLNFFEGYPAPHQAPGAAKGGDVGGFTRGAGGGAKGAGGAVVAAGRASIAALGGGLERTLAALEPHLTKLRRKQHERHA